MNPRKSKSENNIPLTRRMLLYHFGKEIETLYYVGIYPIVTFIDSDALLSADFFAWAHFTPVLHHIFCDVWLFSSLIPHSCPTHSQTENYVNEWKYIFTVYATFCPSSSIFSLTLSNKNIIWQWDFYENVLLEFIIVFFLTFLSLSPIPKGVSVRRIIYSNFLSYHWHQLYSLHVFCVDNTPENCRQLINVFMRNLSPGKNIRFISSLRKKAHICLFFEFSVG